MHDPIYSAKCDDAAMGEDIEAFVVTLAERVDELQDAEYKSDFETLGALAHVLRCRADELGFGSLAASAAAVEACARPGDVDEIREVLVDLTEIARRIRLGHRGAV
jgi:hypothetical protein